MLHGPDISPDGAASERVSHDQVVTDGAASRGARTAQSTSARRDAGGGAAQGAADRDPLARRGEPSPALLSDRRRAGRGRTRGWQHRRRCRPADQLCQCGGKRLADGQSVYGHRGAAEPPPRRGGVHQRPASGRHRDEEPRRRERHPGRGLQPAPDLQGPDPVPVPHERRARDLRRPPCAPRLADRHHRTVHALAHRGWLRRRAEGVRRRSAPSSRGCSRSRGF